MGPVHWGGGGTHFCPVLSEFPPALKISLSSWGGGGGGVEGLLHSHTPRLKAELIYPAKVRVKKHFIIM